MDGVASHCENCGTRVSAADFERGLAFELAERSVCAPCARKLIPTLSPEERRAFQLSCTQNREDW